MAQGRQAEAWDHTAFLAAMLRNIWRGKGQRAIKPSELNPYRKRQSRGIPITKANIKVLKALIRK